MRIGSGLLGQDTARKSPKRDKNSHSSAIVLLLLLVVVGEGVGKRVRIDCVYAYHDNLPKFSRVSVQKTMPGK